MKQGRNILKKLTYPALHWFCRFSQALLLEMYHLGLQPPHYLKLGTVLNTYTHKIMPQCILNMLSVAKQS